MVEKENKIKEIIQRLYGEPAVRRINNRLVEKYGISFDFASSKNDMHELNDILKEEFNRGYEVIIKEFFKTQNTGSREVILNKGDPITDSVIEQLGDLQSLEILNTLSKTKTVYDVFILTKINISTIYRKIEMLCNVGLVSQEKTFQENNGKRQKMFDVTFEKITIEHKDVFYQIRIVPKSHYREYIQRAITNHITTNHITTNQ